MTEGFEQGSNVFVYLTMALYMLAFVVFSFDLARRSSQIGSGAKHVSAKGGSLVASRAGGIGADVRRAKGSRFSSSMVKVATSVATAGWLAHFLVLLLRGFAAQRVPWANMWEFSLMGTFAIVGVFLCVRWMWDIDYLGTFLFGLVLLFQGVSLLWFYVPVVPLQPALQSYWLVIHIIVAVIATGLYALGCGLSTVQLFQIRREKNISSSVGRGFLRTLPAAQKIETLAYRMNVMGFIAWSFTLVAGAIWAQKAWGRFWGWDVKEVWTFVIWVLYAGYIHARVTQRWAGVRSAWLSILGFSAVVFNFTVVNIFFNGLHAYSGL